MLVVDDDEDVRDALAVVIEDEGYAVATASDGVAALEWLEKHGPPCVILLDLMMPRMDGLTFLQKLQDDPRFSRTPVAVVSAGTILRPPPNCPFVAKPVRLERLLEVVEAHCHRA